MKPSTPRSATRPAMLACLAAAAAVLGGVGAACATEPADLLIHGGTVFTGAEEAGGGTVEDVVVQGDRILYVGPDGAARYRARRTIEAKGRIVAPGFIDAHSHPDTYIRSADARQRLNAPWLFQGASTLMIGVDGGGTPDVAAERTAFARQGIGTNVAPYVGFGAVRARVLGQDARAPSAQELERMRQLVARGMCEGAFGLSTGLFYAPQSFAKTDEVVALAREAARHGGLYDTHQRDESSYTIGLLGSVKEVLQIGREAGLPVHFAHLKALGVDVQGQAPQVIALIEAARQAGQEVTADQYPWLASGSNLQASLLPRWSVDGGRPALLKRLEQPDTLARIRAEMRENLRRRGGPGSLLLTTAGQPWTGQTLEQVAAGWKLEPVDAALRIIRSGDRAGSVASFNMAQADVDLIMRQPWVVTSSDGSDGHPRQYATFPEKYAQYVVKRRVITLAQFIRRSTGLTADMLRLDHRGYLRPGYYADVVVFDPDRFAPRADYVHPRVLSAGVETLLVNGKPAIDGGELTGAAAGRELSHPPAPGSCGS